LKKFISSFEIRKVGALFPKFEKVRRGQNEIFKIFFHLSTSIIYKAHISMQEGETNPMVTLAGLGC
jgi:hypothetical protein